MNNAITGSLASGISTRFYNVYQILMPATSDVNSQKYRMIFLQPQRTHTSLAAAIAEDTKSLMLGSLEEISAEFVFLTRITYKTINNQNNYGKCAIETGGITYITGSKATQVTVSGVSPSNHLGLSNLTWSDSGHIGTSSKVAGFDESGNATYYDIISGSSGTSGSSGINGTSGSSGINGTSGSSGTDGTSGSSGINGTSGSSGSSGSSGTDGTSGSSGTDGTSGSSGTDGTSGSSGTSGTSNAAFIDLDKTASVSNVGKIRYRTLSDRSTVEMSMQIGASSYSWVLLKENIW